MPWLQTHLTVSKEQAPLIELLFEELGALSVTLGDAGDEPVLEPLPGETRLWSATKVTGLFDGDTDADELRSRINQALNTDVTRSLELERLEDQAWERAWLERFHPLRFGKRLWIRPTGHEVQAADAVIVDLDPGLAFGTGTHPTTALCLEWLDGQDLQDKSVIDYGCGSGILAVAALKLGAREAVGVDYDPQALIASHDNAQKNGVAARLSLQASDAPDPPAADIVLANILAATLVELEHRLASLTRVGGRIVLSGILHEQADAVSEAFATDFYMADAAIQGDWVRLEGRRR